MLCFKYGNSIETIGRIVAKIESVVNWQDLINCDLNAKVNGRGGFFDYCYEFTMIYDVMLRNGNNMIKTQTIDGFIKITQYNVEYLRLAVTTQLVLATMVVCLKFFRSNRDVLDDGEDPSE